MAYTLRILFNGLCSFVPERSFDSDSRPQLATVLLQDLTEPRRLTGPYSPLPPHYPILELNPRNLQPSTRRTDLVFRPGQPQERHLCVLNGEDLSILAGGTPPTQNQLTYAFGRPVNEQQPTQPGEDRLLWWLAKIEKASGGSGAARRELVDPASDPRPEVTARVRLNAGHLYSYPRDLSPVLYEFRPARPRRYVQSLALVLALEFPGLTGDSVVVFRRFGTSTDERLVLRPPAETPEADVEIQIKNREIDEYIGRDVPRDPALDPRIEPEFEAYYALSLRNALLPKPIPFKLGGDPALRLLCPPTAFEGVE